MATQKIVRFMGDIKLEGTPSAITEALEALTEQRESVINFMRVIIGEGDAKITSEATGGEPHIHNTEEEGYCVSCYRGAKRDMYKDLL